MPIYRRVAVPDCPLTFYDCETGGVDSLCDEIVEMAFVVTDPSGEKILDRWGSKVLPSYPDQVSREAAAINGFDLNIWKTAGAVSISTALTELSKRAEGSIFVAHNVPFDWGFLDAAMTREGRGRKWPGRWYRCDTEKLAWPLLATGKVPNTKLVTLIEYFGMEQANAHAADSDAEDCRRVYVELMKLWKKAFGDVEALTLALS